MKKNIFISAIVIISIVAVFIYQYYFKTIDDRTKDEIIKLGIFRNRNSCVPVPNGVSKFNAEVSNAEEKKKKVYAFAKKRYLSGVVDPNGIVEMFFKYIDIFPTKRMVFKYREYIKAFSFYGNEFRNEINNSDVDETGMFSCDSKAEYLEKVRAEFDEKLKKQIESHPKRRQPEKVVEPNGFLSAFWNLV